MPKAVFALKEIVYGWSPPFGKETKEDTVTIEEGQAFGSMPGMKEPVFKLVKCDGEKVLVEHHGLFTLKGHEHPANRRVWITKEQETGFTYQWGVDGITKSLMLKEIVE